SRHDRRSNTSPQLSGRNSRTTRPRRAVRSASTRAQDALISFHPRLATQTESRFFRNVEPHHCTLSSGLQCIGLKLETTANQSGRRADAPVISRSLPIRRLLLRSYFNLLRPGVRVLAQRRLFMFGSSFPRVSRV